MGSNGPICINLLAIGYVFDNICEVDDRLYFINRLKTLTNAIIKKMNQSDNNKNG